MYRLALIAIQSGACVANPVYDTEDICFAQIYKMEQMHLEGGSIQLETDVDGRKYIVPVQRNLFIKVVEPVEGE